MDHRQSQPILFAILCCFRTPFFRKRKNLLNFLKKLIRIELFLGMAEVGWQASPFL